MAFIGHPLVGELKYSNRDLIPKDTAIVPRIFLHCLRMEFEDMDGSTFVAASDLAADLQVALGRLQAMSREPPLDELTAGPGEKGVKGTISEYLDLAREAPVSKHITDGFCGLQGLLEDSSGSVPAIETALSAEGAEIPLSPPRIV